MNNVTTTKGYETTMVKVMAELYIILTGLAFGFGTQELVHGFSIELFFRFLALCAILLIWLHSQLAVAQLESYKIKKSWFANVLDHYVDTGSAILLVAASLLLNKQTVFCILIALCYVLDAFVEIMSLIKTRRNQAEYKRDRELSWTWIIIDLVTTVILVAIIIIDLKVNIISDLFISLVTLLIILVGNAIDYSKCRDFYFGIPRRKKDARRRRDKFIKAP